MIDKMKSHMGPTQSSNRILSPQMEMDRASSHIKHHMSPELDVRSMHSNNSFKSSFAGAGLSIISNLNLRETTNLRGTEQHRLRQQTHESIHNRLNTQESTLRDHN